MAAPAVQDASEASVRHHEFRPAFLSSGTLRLTFSISKSSSAAPATVQCASAAGTAALESAPALLPAGLVSARLKFRDCPTLIRIHTVKYVPRLYFLSGELFLFAVKERSVSRCDPYHGHCGSPKIRQKARFAFLKLLCVDSEPPCVIYSYPVPMMGNCDVFEIISRPASVFRTIERPVVGS